MSVIVPVPIESCLESIGGWCTDNTRRETVPVVYDTHAKSITTCTGCSRWFDQFEGVSSCTSGTVALKEYVRIEVYLGV